MGDATAYLGYVVDDPIHLVEKPFQVLFHREENQNRTNLRWHFAFAETITNVRGRQKDFTLDEQGFCFLHHPTAFIHWDDRQAIENLYLPEIINLLQQELEDVDHVQIFDWQVRSCLSQTAPDRL